MYTRNVNCLYGGVAENDPAHSSPIGKIPRYSIIKSVTAVVTRLSSQNNCRFKVVLASDSSGTDNTALSNVIEILGEGIAGTWSSGGATDVDILADDGTDGGILYQTYACDGDTLKALDLNDRDYYIYLAYADANHEGGDANPSTSPKVRVCVQVKRPNLNNKIGV